MARRKSSTQTTRRRAHKVGTRFNLRDQLVEMARRLEVIEYVIIIAVDALANKEADCADYAQTVLRIYASNKLYGEIEELRKLAQALPRSAATQRLIARTK